MKYFDWNSSSFCLLNRPYKYLVAPPCPNSVVWSAGQVKKWHHRWCHGGATSFSGGTTDHPGGATTPYGGTTTLYGGTTNLHDGGATIKGGGATIVVGGATNFNLI